MGLTIKQIKTTPGYILKQVPDNEVLSRPHHFHFLMPLYSPSYVKVCFVQDCGWNEGPEMRKEKMITLLLCVWISFMPLRNSPHKT